MSEETSAAESAAASAAGPTVLEASRADVFRPFAQQRRRPLREHDVVAVIVTHNGSAWLGRCLESVDAQTRPLDAVVVVDTGSTDGSADIALAHPCVRQVVQLPADTGFGAAVSAGLARVRPQAAAADGAGPLSWMWILHDDCAAEPTALEVLLEFADDSPSATVLGPKVRGWYDADLLVECGVSIDAAGRRVTDLEPRERDQGQHDSVTDVLAVGSAGMLVQTAVWQRLGGVDPALPFFRDGVDFCWRARRADERVVVVPSAVLHHLEAAARGRRVVPGGSAAHRDRAAAIHTLAVHAPAWRMPFTSVRLLLGSMLRALAHLLARSPRAAAGELGAWAGVHLRPRAALAARRRAGGTAVVPRRDVDQYRPGMAESTARLGEAFNAEFRGGRDPAGPPPGEWLRGAVLTAVLTVIAAVATRTVWSSSGYLGGGALLPAPQSGGDLWTQFTAAWHDVGLGTVAPSPPYVLLVIALAALPVLDPNAALMLLILGAVPLAGLSAFLALRTIVAGPSRAFLAAAYALLPAAAGTSTNGRLGTAMAWICLPVLARLLARLILVGRVGALPVPGVRTYAGAALLLCLVTSVAPVLWPLSAVLALLLAALQLRRRASWVGLLLVLVSPAVVLYPWSLTLLANPQMLAFEAGISSPSLVADDLHGWQLLLQDPGLLGPWTPLVAVPLLLAAFAALLNRRTRPAALAGWLVLLIALAAMAILTRAEFVPPGASPGTGAMPGYPGPLMAVAAVAMLAAAAVLAAGIVPTDTVRRNRSASAIGLGLLVLSGPVVSAALWTTSWAGPLDRGEAIAVPAFIAQEAQSPDRIRVLVLAPEGDGVAYTLVNNGGAVLPEADTPPTAESWQPIDEAVGDLAAGVGGDEVAVLASVGVRYVLAPEGEDLTLSRTLDATEGLRHLSTTDGQGMWEVARVTSRVQHRVAGRSMPVPAVPVDSAGARAGQLVDTTVNGSGTQVSLGMSPGIPWRATLDGGEAVVTDAGGVAVIAQAESQSAVAVSVGLDAAARVRSLAGPTAVLLVLLILLVPAARHVDEVADPDVDTAAEPGIA